MTTPGGVVTITLTDVDLDVGQVQTDEAVDVAGAAYQVSGLAAGAIANFFVQKFPLLDGNADGIINRFDATIATSTGVDLTALGLTVFIVLFSDGRVDIQNNTTTANAITAGFTLTYTAAEVQTHTVKVSSAQDAVGFDITVKETGSNTGVFGATFQTGPATVFQLQGGVLESDIGVDLNGNGTT